ncbi:hypothetical protein QWY81_17725 [Polaribacter undariae]|uniref:Uncharacterized protein n=1 Tax=Polaribacter sejongensis TaxID=985043 RepID=A0AAJ1VI47_9FLAO|nr:hypothetical protein [Polaribacter undariae]MDN3621311.1 hypothetical protein [Polaribacter undariae]UWD31853.1 hypothetical protein NQP51_17190 [Polaribacter undariae]
MKTPIHKLVGYTEQEYEDLIFKIMFKWADIHSQGSDSKMQFLFANRKVNNWFQAELKKLLALFREDVSAAENFYETNTKDRRRLLVFTLTKVFKVYPRVFIDQYKKTGVIIGDKKFSNN